MTFTFSTAAVSCYNRYQLNMSSTYIFPLTLTWGSFFYFSLFFSFPSAENRFIFLLRRDFSFAAEDDIHIRILIFNSTFPNLALIFPNYFPWLSQISLLRSTYTAIPRIYPRLSAVYPRHLHGKSTFFKTLLYSKTVIFPSFFFILLSYFHFLSNFSFLSAEKTMKIRRYCYHLTIILVYHPYFSIHYRT